MVGIDVLGTVVASIFLLFLLLACGRFYYTMARRVLRGEGLVNPSGLGFPDLLVVGVMVIWFGNLFFQLLLAPGGGDRATPALSVEFLAKGMLVQGFIIVCILGFLLSRRISPVELFGLRRMSVLRVLGWASLMLLAALPLVHLVMWVTVQLMGDSAKSQEIITYFIDAINRGDWGPIFITFATGVVAAPLTEEIVFRGYLYPLGKRFIGPAASALVSSLLFAAIHFNALSFPALVLLAICFVLAFEATGSLAVPMVMHAGFNAISLAQTIFFPSHLP